MLGVFTLLIARNYKFVAILWDRNDLEQERRRGQSLGTVRCRKKNPVLQHFEVYARRKLW
jgi:hypothetical protein